jgi:hypothetical protein
VKPQGLDVVHDARRLKDENIDILDFELGEQGVSASAR